MSGENRGGKQQIALEGEREEGRKRRVKERIGGKRKREKRIATPPVPLRKKKKKIKWLVGF